MLPLERLRDYLLPKTLEYAVHNSPFYAQHFGDAWRDVTRVADLVRLPMLDKATAVREQDRMRCGPVVTDLGAMSSGTTRIGDAFLHVQHSPAEEDALDEYFDMLAAEAPPAVELEPRGSSEIREAPADAPPHDAGLLLHVIGVHHGIPPPPGPDTLRLGWVDHPSICDMIRNVFEREHGGRRVTALKASVAVMKNLTVYYLDKNVDLRAFGIEEIGTNSGLLTPRWRRLIEEHWGAPIFDNYSLSEFASPANECEACGAYHFQPPPLVWEVLDPHSGAQLDEGLGHLVLSGLYPYVQRQPLLRYRTGDIVEKGPVCPRAGDHGLRFRGRLQQSPHRARAGGTEYLVLSGDLECVVDELPDVARHTWVLEKVGVMPPGRAGQPKVHAALVEGRAVAHVGTVFDPRLFAERAREIERTVQEGLAALNPSLRRALEEDSAAVQVRAVHGSAELPWFVKGQPAVVKD